MHREVFLAHLMQGEKSVHFFDVPARFPILPSPMYNSLPCLIVDYNPSHKLLAPSHKLLAQLRTVTKSLRRLGLAMLR